MSNEEIAAQGQGSRPMPDFVKRGLIRVQGGLLYLKAPYRVLWMREEHPDWGILSEIVFADYEKGFAVAKATILDGNGNIIAIAHSEENRGKLPYIKKAETGAISRALALAGYGTQFGELDDEEAGEPGGIGDSPVGQGSSAIRGAGEPGISAGSTNSGAGPCPSCNAPSGKRHATTCRA